MIDNNDHPLAVKQEDKEESNLDLGEEYTEDKDTEDKKDDQNDDKNTDKKDDYEDKEDDKNSDKDEDDEKDNFKTEIAECKSKQLVCAIHDHFYNHFCSGRGSYTSTS